MSTFKVLYAITCSSKKRATYSMFTTLSHVSQATHKCLTNGSIYTHTWHNIKSLYTNLSTLYQSAVCLCCPWVLDHKHTHHSGVTAHRSALQTSIFSGIVTPLACHLFPSKVNSDEWLHFIKLVKERSKWRFTVHRGINLERWHCGMLTNYHSYVSIHSFHVISAVLGRAQLAGKGYSTVVLCPPTIVWTPLCSS